MLAVQRCDLISVLVGFLSINKNEMLTTKINVCISLEDVVLAFTWHMVQESVSRSVDGASSRLILVDM